MSQRSIFLASLPFANDFMAVLGQVGRRRALQVIDFTSSIFQWSPNEPRGRGLMSCGARHTSKASATSRGLFHCCAPSGFGVSKQSVTDAEAVRGPLQWSMAPSGPRIRPGGGGRHERTENRFTDVEHVVISCLVPAQAACLRRRAGAPASRVLCDPAVALAVAPSQRVVDALIPKASARAGAFFIPARRKPGSCRNGRRARHAQPLP